MATSISRHCTQCKEGSPCNWDPVTGKRRDTYHVYVLELNEEIMGKQWFEDRNPNYESGKPCVYVGMSGHLPKCRRSIHVNDSPKVPLEKKEYSCFCGDGSKKKKFGKSTKGSRKVRPFNKFRLLSSLFKPGPWGENPQETREDSEKAECMLADYLRSEGYGVWEGKRGKKCKETYLFD